MRYGDRLKYYQLDSETNGVEKGIKLVNSYFEYVQWAINYWYIDPLYLSNPKEDWIFQITLDRIKANLESIWMHKVLIPAQNINDGISIIYNCEVNRFMGLFKCCRNGNIKSCTILNMNLT